MGARIRNVREVPFSGPSPQGPWVGLEVRMARERVFVGGLRAVFIAQPDPGDAKIVEDLGEMDGRDRGVRGERRQRGERRL